MAAGPTKRRPSLVGEAKAERLRSTQRPAARPYSQRKRNYSKHLRLLWVLLLPSRPRSSFPPSRAHPGKEFFSLWQTRAESVRLRGEPPPPVPARFLRPQSLRLWPTNCPASSADPQVDGPSWKDAAALGPMQTYKGKNVPVSPAC